MAAKAEFIDEQCTRDGHGMHTTVRRAYRYDGHDMAFWLAHFVHANAAKYADWLSLSQGPAHPIQENIF